MASEKKSNSVMWFIFGAVAGTVAGVLLAPKAGKETREDIKDWLAERREKGSALLGRLRERFPAKKEQLNAAFKAGKQAYYENGKKEALDA